MLQIVSALVRRGDDVLLVKQQGPEDLEPYWALPGGVAEPGELLVEALAREVREETGLELLDPGHLAFVMQRDSPSRDEQSLVFCFEITGWSGEIAWQDPDGFVSEARFFSLREAISMLGRVPWWDMRETIAHLRGEAPRGSLWIYRERPDGSDDLIAYVRGRS